MRTESNRITDEIVPQTLRKLIDRYTGTVITEAQAHVLVRTLNALATEQDQRKLLDRLLLAITKELGGHSASLWLHDSKGRTNAYYEVANDDDALKSPGKAERALNPKRAPFSQALMMRVLTEGPTVIHRVSDSNLIDPGTRKWMEAHGAQSLLCVPLTVGENTLGIFTIRAASPHAFDGGEGALGQLLAHQVALAVHLRNLAEKVEETATLTERTRLAQEIHDSLTQDLAAVVTRLELALDSFPECPTDALAHIRKAQDLARQSLTEARRSVWALAPQQLQGHDLVGAIRKWVEHLHDDAGTAIHFSLHGKPSRLPEQTEVHLLRITQEAVHNALKHGEATQIHIELNFTREKVALAVADDGRGFDCHQKDGRQGFGLLSLRERARRAGGLATIESQTGGGTRIKVELPAAPQNYEGYLDC